MIVKVPIGFELSHPTTNPTECGRILENCLKSSLKTPVDDLLGRHGKKIRSEIIQIAYAAGGGEGIPDQALLDFIELLHAGSLAIDDIQDNAVCRRGEPALHVRYGVPLAINTGNWMYFAAIEKLNDLNVDADLALLILRKVLVVIRRCHEGQALDLSLQFDQLDQHQTLEIASEISNLKTGALTALAAWLGAVSAGCDAENAEMISRFGWHLGIGLQMQNDFVELQKTAFCGTQSQDLLNKRVTWPWAWLSTTVGRDDYRALVHVPQLTPDQQIELAKAILERIEIVAVDEIGHRLDQAANDIVDWLPDATWQQRLNQLIATLELRYA